MAKVQIRNYGVEITLGITGKLCVQSYLVDSLKISDKFLWSGKLFW